MTRKIMIAALSVVVGVPAIALDNAQARSKRHVAHSYTSGNAYGSWDNSWGSWGAQGRSGNGWSDWQGGWSSGPQSWNRPRMRRQNSFEGTPLDSMIASHAAANGVSPDLARRVVARESGGNARAVSKGNYGLMQIRLGTARAMGYTGSAAGLLDPDTNMTYAMKYLAGAQRAAGGDPDRAVALYARGYYYEAKRQGWSPYQTAGFGGEGYGAYASGRPMRAQRYASADNWSEQGWSSWNQNDSWNDKSARHGRQIAWNDPSWGSWRNDMSSNSWQDSNAPRRVHRKRS